jgi:cytochrome b
MVRVGHWALASFFFLAYTLGGDRLNLHAHAGYTVALLVGFRVLWGFVGSPHARFADFVVSPSRLLSYMQRLATAGSPTRMPIHAGHDPAGGVMIVALLLVLATTAGSGMVLFAMENRGPLPRGWVADWPGAVVETVHHTAADLSLILVIAHVTGVLVMSILLRQNLIAAMIHGRKKAGPSGVS